MSVVARFNPRTTSPELDENKIRAHILKFYAQNDVDFAGVGADISGMVKWTVQNGPDALNNVLRKKFGKTIDFNANLGSKALQLKTASYVISPEASTSRLRLAQFAEEESRRKRIRAKLEKFYLKHDPKKLSNLGEVTRYALISGVDKLNLKLRKKYGEGIDFEDLAMTGNDRAISQHRDITKRAISVSRTQHDKQNFLKKFNKAMLRKDLARYYIAVNDPEQIEILTEILEWIDMIGLEKFNEKTEQLYGVSLMDKVSEMKQDDKKQRTGSFISRYTAPPPPPVSDRESIASTWTTTSSLPPPPPEDEPMREIVRGLTNGVDRSSTQTTMSEAIRRFNHTRDENSGNPRISTTSSAPPVQEFTPPALPPLPVMRSAQKPKVPKVPKLPKLPKLPQFTKSSSKLSTVQSSHPSPIPVLPSPTPLTPAVPAPYVSPEAKLPRKNRTNHMKSGTSSKDGSRLMPKDSVSSRSVKYNGPKYSVAGNGSFYEVSEPKKKEDMAKIDTDRLRSDLKRFYESMHDVEQTELLDDVIEVIEIIGLEEFNMNTRTLYGVSFMERLRELELADKYEPRISKGWTEADRSSTQSAVTINAESLASSPKQKKDKSIGVTSDGSSFSSPHRQIQRESVPSSTVGTVSELESYEIVNRFFDISLVRLNRRDSDDLNIDDDEDENGYNWEKLKTVLGVYYEEVEDEEQIEVIDDIVQWIKDDGIQSFNERTQQLYGISFLDKLLELNRELEIDDTMEEPGERGSNHSDNSPYPEEEEEEEEELGIEEFPNREGGFLEELDTEELRKDLVLFYKVVHDMEEEDVGFIDEVMDVIDKVSLEEFDINTEVLYGISFFEKIDEIKADKDFLRKLKQQKRKNGSVFTARSNASLLQLDPDEIRKLRNESRLKQGSVASGTKTFLRGIIGEGSFSGMSQVGGSFSGMSERNIKSEILHFYKKHGSPEHGRIHAVIDLAKELGREKFNARLKEMYGETLDDLSVTGKVYSVRDLSIATKARRYTRDETVSPGSAYLSRDGSTSYTKTTGRTDESSVFIIRDGKNLSYGGRFDKIAKRSPETASPSSQNDFVWDPQTKKESRIQKSASKNSKSSDNKIKSKLKGAVKFFTKAKPRTVQQPPNLSKRPAWKSTQSKHKSRKTAGKVSEDVLSNSWVGGSENSSLKRLDSQFEDGPCDEYELDMNGDGFGMCLCGFPKSDHADKDAFTRNWLKESGRASSESVGTATSIAKSIAASSKTSASSRTSGALRPDVVRSMSGNREMSI